MIGHTDKTPNLYDFIYSDDEYKDVSDNVFEAMLDDDYIYEGAKNNLQRYNSHTKKIIERIIKKREKKDG